jgi:hypothetical protein
VGRRRVPGSGRSDDDRLIAEVITAVREQRAALSSHFSRCPNRQLQRSAQCSQVCIPWPSATRFPKIYARSGYANSFSDFSDR